MGTAVPIVSYLWFTVVEAFRCSCSSVCVACSEVKRLEICTQRLRQVMKAGKERSRVRLCLCRKQVEMRWRRNGKVIIASGILGVAVHHQKLALFAAVKTVYAYMHY